MGKEILRRHSNQNLQPKGFQSQQISSSFESLIPEFDAFWNLGKSLKEENIIENMQITITIRNKEGDKTIILSELNKKCNETKEIFKQLLKYNFINPKTKVRNFLKLKENIWSKIDIINSLVYSGDKFLLVVDCPPIKESVSNNKPIHKAIRKAIKKYEYDYY